MTRQRGSQNKTDKRGPTIEQAQAEMFVVLRSDDKVLWSLDMSRAVMYKTRHEG